MCWVESARIVVDTKSARRIDPENGEILGYATDGEDGVILDLFSASAMLEVHDALSNENRDKFAAMDVVRAQEVTFMVIGRQAQ